MTKIARRTKHVHRFGLIGHPLNHSLSPLIHEQIMEVIGVEGKYELYDLQPEALARELPKLLRTLAGFNCTIPYKTAIIPYLRGLAPGAALYGAVNTVYDGVGYNTDGVAFANCQVPMKGRTVCVLGAGGVARVLVVEAINAGALRVFVYARNPKQAENLVREVKSKGYQNVHVIAETKQERTCDVFLNGTPVGMWPNLRDIPISNCQIKNAQAVFDSIYNPTATRLVLKAKSEGIWAENGLQMLFEQALAAQKIWHPQVNFKQFEPQLEEVSMNLAVEVMRKWPFKLILTGFMGSGKTTVGKILASKLDLPFLDLDDLIVQAAGQSIAEIFASQGEAVFRSLEKQFFLEQLNHPGAMVLATGGGTLLQADAINALRETRALVIYLEIPFEIALERLESDTSTIRPLLAKGRELYEKRKPHYEALADLKLSGQENPEEVAKAIMTCFDWNLVGR